MRWGSYFGCASFCLGTCNMWRSSPAVWWVNRVLRIARCWWWQDLAAGSSRLCRCMSGDHGAPSEGPAQPLFVLSTVPFSGVVPPTWWRCRGASIILHPSWFSPLVKIMICLDRMMVASWTSFPFYRRCSWRYDPMGGTHADGAWFESGEQIFGASMLR
jgi:hypothetical protein